MDVKNRINLSELNSIIETYRDMMDISLNYDFIEYAATMLMRKSNFKPQRVYIKYYNPEQAIGIALDFFKSLGIDEWYNNARNIILGKDKRIGINIYDYKNIKDKNKKDENGIQMYTPDSSTEGKIDEYDKYNFRNSTPRSLVRISKQDRYDDLPNIISKEKFTLDDIYSIVHEISHTFDLENDVFSVNQRRIYSEIPTFCFEKMLGKYLTDNNIVEERVVESIERQRIEDVMYHTKHVYVIMNLMRIQEEEGLITKESIDKFTRSRNIRNVEFIRQSLMDVLELDIDLNLHIKYLIAGLTSSQFIKLYNQDKKQAIENLYLYCQDVKEGYLGEETLDLVRCPIETKDIDDAINDITESIER